ncbi:MAG: tetratricopeptide repeat protein [Candidatus Omnitrophota bacterium]
MKRIILILIFLIILSLFIKVDIGYCVTEEEYNELMKQYEAVKNDRDNILYQTKRLLNERKDTAQLREAIELAQKEKEAILKEQEDLKHKIEGLQAKISKLESEKSNIESERDSFKESYNSMLKGTEINKIKHEMADMEKKYKEDMDILKKELEFKTSDLRDENAYLSKDLKVAQKVAEKLKTYKEDAEKKIQALDSKVNQFNKDYKEALKKNNTLVKEIQHMPKKFTEVARQNKTLLKETSQMHYNLGVFYTKEQEYKRAIAEFLKAVEINPEDAYSHFNLGYIYAEYIVNREEAIKHFRHYLRLAKSNDNDIDWVRKYLLTWETYEGSRNIK